MKIQKEETESQSSIDQRARWIGRERRKPLKKESERRNESGGEDEAVSGEDVDVHAVDGGEFI